MRQQQSFYTEKHFESQENSLTTKTCLTIRNLLWICFENLYYNMQQIRPTTAPHCIHNKPFIFKDLYTCGHVFLRDDLARRLLKQPYTGPHRIARRISERNFAIEVDGRRLNVLVKRLKPAYFTAHQEEYSTPVNEPVTMQPLMEPFSSRKTYSILKTYPSAPQL